MISFTCNNCGFAKSVSDSYAGKKVACPKCKNPTKLGCMSKAAVQNSTKVMRSNKGPGQLPPLRSENDAGGFDKTTKQIIVITSCIFGLMVLFCGGCLTLSLLLMPSEEQLAEMRASAEAHRIKEEERQEKAFAETLIRLQNSDGIGISAQQFYSWTSLGKTLRERLNNAALICGGRIQIERDETGMVRRKCGGAFEVTTTGAPENVTGIFVRYSKENALKEALKGASYHPTVDQFLEKDLPAILFVDVVATAYEATISGDPNSESNLKIFVELLEDCPDRSFTLVQGNIKYNCRATYDGFALGITRKEIDIDPARFFSSVSNPEVRPAEKTAGNTERLDSIAREVPIGNKPEIGSAPVNPEVAADNVTRPDSDVKGNQDNEKIAEDVQPKKPEISVGAGGELESSKRFPLDNDIPTELRELVGKQQEKLLNGLWDIVEASQQELTTTKNVFGESKVVKRLKTKIATLENSIRAELQSGDTWLFKVTGFKVNFGTPIVFTEFGVNSVRIGSDRYRLESLYKCELIPEENLQTEGIEDWIPGDWILATVKPDGRTNIIPQVRIDRKKGSSLERTGIVFDLLDFRRIGQTKLDFQKFLTETKDAQTQQPVEPSPTVNSTIRSTRKVALKAGFYEGTNGDGKIELIIKGDLIIQVSEKDPTLFTKIWKKELRHPLNEESRQMFSQAPNRENLLVVQQLDRFVISADVIPTNGDLSDIQDSFTVTRKNNNMKIRRPDRSASRGLKSNWKAIIQRSAPQLLQEIK